MSRNILGKPVLCRNLDYSNADLLRNVIFKANFIGNSGLKFEGVMIAGFTGLHTGTKDNGFAVAVNARYYYSQPATTVDTHI